MVVGFGGSRRGGRVWRRLAAARLAALLLGLVTGGLVMLSYCRGARAEDVPEGRVRIERPLGNDTLVDESVTHTLGKLSTLKLEVEVLHRSSSALIQRQLPALESGIHGLIAIYRFE